MLRVKDPAVLLDFYTRLFGMRVLRKLDFPEMKFSLYFLQRALAADVAPEDVGERTAWTVSQHGLLELTHNWGTENDPAFIKDPDGYWIEIVEPARLTNLGR
jgi:lactoylglutathione lyase